MARKQDRLLIVTRRLERWAQWLRQQQQVRGYPESLLGALLGESMEGYRRGGLAQLYKAFACLIHGQGQHPDSQDDDAAEWEVQAGFDVMPKYMREIKRVLYAEFLSLATNETNARRLHLTVATYRSHLSAGLTWMDGYLYGTSDSS